MCGGWWESGVPRRWGVAEGHGVGVGVSKQPALVWVRGNGRHRGDGLPAGAQHHGSLVWAAAAHGWVSNRYTEHLQTDKKKKNKPIGHKWKLLLSFFPQSFSFSSALGFPWRKVRVVAGPSDLPDPISSNHSSPMTTTVYRQEAMCKMFIKPSGPLVKQHSLP